MILDFGEYEYIDPTKGEANVKGKGPWYYQFEYSESDFNTLINQRRFEEAAAYLSKYRFKDAKKQEQLNNYIINISRNGRQLGAMYNRIPDTNVRNKIEFYNNVFRNHGLEDLNTEDINSSETFNSYAKEFISIKDKLGAQYDGRGNLVRSYDKIGVVFKPKVKALFGIDKLDWLEADNQYNIDAFFEETGFNRNTLRAEGIEVIDKDGYTELKFSKSHPLANKILYHTPKPTPISGDMPFSYNHDKPYIVGYDEKGVGRVGLNNLAKFQQYIDDAKDAKDVTFTKLNLDKKLYSSTIMPWISDALQNIRETSNTEEEYNRRAKTEAPFIFNAINSFDYTSTPIYTNYNSGRDTNELFEVTGDSRDDIIEIMRSAKPSELQIDAMISNGEIGALVTIKPLIEFDNNKTKINRRGYQIFIPGLLLNEAQTRINNDTEARAIQEANSMVDWGYDYVCANGTKLSVGVEGFKRNNETISKEEAIRDINRDICITSMKNNLNYKYTSKQGNIIDKQAYEADARNCAIAVGAELYKGKIYQLDNTGTNFSINGTLFTINDIFDKSQDKTATQYETWDIIRDIYDIYNDIMHDLVYLK